MATRGPVIKPFLSRGKIAIPREHTVLNDAGRANTLLAIEGLIPPRPPQMPSPRIGDRATYLPPPDGITVPGWKSKRNGHPTIEVTPPTTQFILNKKKLVSNAFAEDSSGIIIINDDDIIEDSQETTGKFGDDEGDTGQWHRNEPTYLLIRKEDTALINHGYIKEIEEHEALARAIKATSPKNSMTTPVEIAGKGKKNVQAIYKPSSVPPVMAAAKNLGLEAIVLMNISNINQIVNELISRGSLDHKNLNGKVLDFMCRDGSGSYVLQQYGGEVLSLSSNGAQLNYAKEKKLAQKAVKGDELSYLGKAKADFFDLIAAFDLVWNSPMPYGRLYEQSLRVLKSGGQLIVTCPESLADSLENNFDLERIHKGKMEPFMTRYGSQPTQHIVFSYTKK